MSNRNTILKLKGEKIMKHRNIQRVLALLSSFVTLAVVALFFSSCSKNEDELFDTPANDRVTLKMQEFKKQLVSSENGWIMNYYPHEQKKYGGYVIALKFTDKDEVLATSETLFKDKNGKNKPLEWFKSNFLINNDRAVTLNFATYNKAIHLYSNPDLPYGEGLGVGLGGDHEFLLMTSDNPDVIVLEGKNTHNVIKLHRAKKALATYMEEIRACKDVVFTNKLFIKEHKDSFRGIIDGKEAIFTLSEEGYNIYNVHIPGKVKFDASGKKVLDIKPVNESLPFHYTPTGIEFDEPFKGIKGFTWSKADNCFEVDGKKFQAHDDPDWPAFSKFLGKWILRVVDQKTEDNKDYDVTFETLRRNVYLIKGLPFDLQAGFDAEHNRFFINAQVVENVTYLQGWAAREGGRLTKDPDVGMYAELAKNSTDTYNMRDNGYWGSYKVDSFLLWGGKAEGEYTEFGVSRFLFPRFIKK